MDIDRLEDFLRHIIVSPDFFIEEVSTEDFSLIFDEDFQEMILLR